ncbi:MAG: amidohydrolase family protein [Ferruginibacter sp.]|nr:amidohydrolase family protein [Ferruginibacter sp.]
MYRKFTAEKIFSGRAMMPEGSVLIVRADGTVEAIVDRDEAGEGGQYFEGILSPGLVNCHCHLELSHMKGIIPEGAGMVDFLLSVVQQRNISEQIILESIEKAEAEMLANGIVAVGDICNTDFTIRQKSKKNLYYYNFIEVSGYAPSVAGSRFEKARGLYDKFVSIGSDASIVPHATYSLSGDLLKKINQFQQNNVLTIHNQESDIEDEWIREKKGDLTRLYHQLSIATDFFQPQGISSLHYFLNPISEFRPLILVHNLFSTDADVQYANQLFSQHNSQLYYCLCPNANMYINKKLPDVDLFINNQCKIVLGTDSLSSNKQLSIHEEIKTLQNAYPHIRLEQFLQWATINGAEALGISDTFGSFEKGKKPGIVLWDEDVLNVKCLQV